jgi:nitrate/nitrite-specific signal transduction histidine kinase
VYVDKEIQGGLVWMAARYWAVSLAVIGMLTVIGWVFVAPGVAQLVDSPERLRSLLACLVVALVAAAALLPIVLLDMVKYSHRFVGPMVRLRESMQRAAAGEPVDPIRFRDADYWQELADAFNAMQARIERLEQGRAKDVA